MKTMRWIAALSVCMVFFIYVIPAQSATIYVKTDGDNGNNGSSWTLAKATVQAGIDAAFSGDEVWVAQGTYNESITLKEGVALKGGFSGSGETRDPSTYETILDGTGKDNSVIVGSGITSATMVDGFTIQNGVGDYWAGRRTGGGINLYQASPVISNNVIKNNTAAEAGGGSGGGIFCNESSATIENNTFTGNTASHGGGAICCYASAPLITRNVISGNVADDTNYLYPSGGGISITSSSQPTVSYNIISGNGAEYGAGIYCVGSSSAIIVNNIVKANTAGSAGGGIYISGASPTVTNNTIVGNSSASNNGGGIFSGSLAYPAVSNNIIAFNTSGYGVAATGGSLVYYNNCFYGNSPGNYTGPVVGFGNIFSDPLFVVDDEDYHLQQGSPCINAGWNFASSLPESDMDEESHIFGGIVDIGVDEYPDSTTSSILGGKFAAADSPFAVQSMIVSAAFPDYFYIESDDRSSGIRVDKVGHGLSAGMRANVSGSVKTNSDGERYIEATTISQNGTGTVTPLGMNNRTVGGEAIGLQAGITGAYGWNNIGLLIKTWGKVVEKDTVNNPPAWIRIDDGTGLYDAGQRVEVLLSAELPPYIDVGSHMAVTGISSCYKEGSNIRRLIRARTSDDVVLDLGDAFSTSLGQQFNLTAPPIAPFDSEPANLFRTSAGDPIDISGINLQRWDPITQQYISYDSQNPQTYGVMLVGEGAYLKNVSGGSLTWQYTGASDDVYGTTDMAVSLPRSGSTLIGHPFNHKLALVDCLVMDGAQTLSWNTASAAGWMTGMLLGYRNINQGYYSVGTSPDPIDYDSASIEPFLGYWAYPKRNNIAVIIPADYRGPDGTVTIANGAEYTNSLSVTLTLSATTTDPSGIAWMRFSNDDANWSDWEEYATSRTWDITSGSDGVRTVYVQYRDGVSRESVSFSDTITYDTTCPTCTATGPASPSDMMPLCFNLTFSEPVSDLTLGEITVTGAEKWSLYGSGSVYDVSVVPSASGTVTCQVPANVAQDAAGNQNVSSNIASVTYAAIPIRDSKFVPDNTSVSITAAIVSAAFTDYFYVELDDRSSGIRVDKVAHGLTVVMRADVSGQVKTNADGERYIDAATATQNGTGIVTPIGMNNRTMGGGVLGLQEGIGDAFGWNNIGLLIKTWGEVTDVDSAVPPTWFKIDDGFGLYDPSQRIKVTLAPGMTVPDVGDYVSVVGASSCYRNSGVIYRLLKPRDSNDVREFDSFSTVSYRLVPGFNLIAPPLVPVDPDATAVFKTDAGQAITIEELLQRYDGILARYIPYFTSQPADYGGVVMGDGAFLYNSGSEMTWSYSGIPDGIPDVGGMMTDICVSLPAHGFSLVGHPFNHRVALIDCLVTDGTRILSWDDATDAGWTTAFIYGYIDGYYTVETNPDPGTSSVTSLDPFHGYHVETYYDNLAVIIPAAFRGPTGSVSINNGDQSTNSASVTLTLSATTTDPSGVDWMRFSNDDTNWSGWEEYATSKSWELASGSDGERTVHVQFRDGAGRESDSSSDTITLSTSGTVSGTVLANRYEGGGQLPALAGAQVAEGTISDDTDIVGEYSLSLPAGSHVLTASKQGYQPQTSTVNVAAGASVWLDYTLNPGTTEWNAANGFGSQNPSGDWSYGYEVLLGGTFYPYGSFQSDVLGQLWCVSGQTDSYGYVVKNTTGSDVETTDHLVRSGELALHPGTEDKITVVRWTAPVDAVIEIDAAFTAQERNYQHTDLHILKNSGESIFDAQTSGSMTDPWHAFPLENHCHTFTRVLLGDTIDFTVSKAPVQFGGIQRLNATITIVPADVGLITGIVRTDESAYRSKEPIAGATVEARDLDDLFIASTQTDAYGAYRLALQGATDASPNSYKIIVSYSENSTAPQDYVDIIQNQETQKDFSLSQTTQGNIYYVNSSAGNDSYDGLAPAWNGQHGPWATIDHADAYELLQPGDTVFIAGGIYPQSDYRGPHLANCSGDLVSPIRYRAMDFANRPVIDQSSYDIELQPKGIWINASGVSIEGFEIKDCLIGIENFGTQDNTIANCVIHDGRAGQSASPDGIAYALSQNTLIHHSLIYDMGFPTDLGTGIFGGYNNHTKIYNNTISNCWAGLDIYGNDFGLEISNNIIANMSFSGICLSGTNEFVNRNHNNLFWNNGNPQGNNYIGTALSGINDLTDVDPMFRDVAGRDYHLQSHSPATDGGYTTVAQPAWNDIDGQQCVNYTNGQVTALYGPAIDIGADEVVGTIPPTGTISINDGDAYTNDTNRNVTLTIPTATAGVTKVGFRNEGGTWSQEWYDYSQQFSQSWQLSVGEGTKTVYVRFQDGDGNTTPDSSAPSDTIILDTAPPTGGSVSINGGQSTTNNLSVTLTATASDSRSGVSKVSFSNNGTNWTPFDYPWGSVSWELTTGDGVKTIYARFEDGAGNISTTYNDTIILDTTAPSGNIVIDNDNQYTNRSDRSVTLNMSVSGTTEMCFSNDNSNWSGWQSYSATKSWTLAAGADGTRTVYGKFRDAAQNEFTDSDTIILDTTAPTGGTLTITDLDNTNTQHATQYTNSLTVKLTDISATDSTSGVEKMKFSNADSNWDSIAWEDYAPNKASWTLTSGSDSTRTVYARFKDRAGNESSTCSDTIILDTTAPSITPGQPSPSAVRVGATVSMSFTASDGSGSLAATPIVVVNGTSRPCNGTYPNYNFSYSALGNDTISISCADKAGYPAGPITPAGATVVMPPQITAYQVDSTGTVKLTWTYNPGPLLYSHEHVFYRVNGGPPWLQHNLFDVLDASHPNYRVWSLIGGSICDFKVVAYDTIDHQYPYESGVRSVEINGAASLGYFFEKYRVWLGSPVNQYLAADEMGQRYSPAY